MPLLEVGRVVRAHGIKGEVVVELVTTVAERLESGSVLEAGGQRLVVELARPLPGKRGTMVSRWLVRFEGMVSRDAAEALRGVVLEAEPTEGAEGLWVHEVIGCTVWDSAGPPVGTVVAVEANPASDLLVLDNGALVPMCFVTGKQAGRLTVDLPPGLLEL
ncbi:MAG: ribosome maturation factor RimM [Acidimicrobiales bacterium]